MRPRATWRDGHRVANERLMHRRLYEGFGGSAGGDAADGAAVDLETAACYFRPCMPEPVFRGDPYAVLGVERAATTAHIKRRWRELAREHHPDRAVGNDAEAEERTTRMARINAAYDLLRDPVRRARYDASPQGRRAGETASRR